MSGTTVKITTTIKRMAPLRNGDIWLLIEGWNEAILVNGDECERNAGLALVQIGDTVDIEFNTRTVFGCIKLLKFYNISMNQKSDKL